MSSDHDIMALSIKRGERKSTYDDMISASTREQLEHYCIISPVNSCSFHSHVVDTLRAYLKRDLYRRRRCKDGRYVRQQPMS